VRSLSIAGRHKNVSNINIEGEAKGLESVELRRLQLLLIPVGGGRIRQQQPLCAMRIQRIPSHSHAHRAVKSSEMANELHSLVGTVANQNICLLALFHTPAACWLSRSHANVGLVALCLCVCVSVCLCVCLSVFLFRFLCCCLWHRQTSLCLNANRQRRTSQTLDSRFSDLESRLSAVSKTRSEASLLRGH